MNNVSQLYTIGYECATEALKRKHNTINADTQTNSPVKTGHDNYNYKWHLD
jgi:hypothetical protein